MKNVDEILQSGESDPEKKSFERARLALMRADILSRIESSGALQESEVKESDAVAKALEFLETVTEGNELDPQELFARIFARRQDTISGGFSAEVSKLVGEYLPTDPRAQLLEAVAHYDAAAKIKEAADKDIAYREIYENLITLSLPDDALTEFLQWNYAFLAGRNAKVYLQESLDPVYTNAMAQVERMDGVMRMEQAGYVTYNMARHLFDNLQQKEEAKNLFIESAVHRIQWYEALVALPDALEATRLSAAQQVAKIYLDWNKYCEGVPLSDCPITHAMMVEMAMRFGEEAISKSAFTKQIFRIAS